MNASLCGLIVYDSFGAAKGTSEEIARMLLSPLREVSL